jgi:hypothetical protein
MLEVLNTAIVAELAAQAAAPALDIPASVSTLLGNN